MDKISKKRHGSSFTNSLSNIWNIVQDEYELLQYLGKGSFGEVVQARNKSSQQIVAIKLIQNLFKDEYRSRKVVSEIQILVQLTMMKGNIFTTKIIDIITPKVIEQMSYIFIVMEYIESDLKKMLINTNIIEFDQSHILTILYNSLCALNFVHSANIMHRDIKPANILIDSNCQIKICDFGLSRTQLESSFDKLIGIKTNEQQNNFYLTKRKSNLKLNNNILVKQQNSQFNEFNLQNKSQNILFSPKRKLFTTNILQALNNIDNNKCNAKKQAISEQIIQMKKIREGQKRQLSNHVISRWYRPPEIILIEKQYNQAIDIWGLGCVLAEMIYCSNDYKNLKKHQVDNRFLFPGNSCFPLSPCEEMKDSKDQEVNIVSQNDQLKLILDVLGSQNQHDISFITEQSAVSYQKSLCSQNNKANQLRKLFRYSSNELIDLLQSMLEFNPYFRFSAQECLKNKIFDQVRVPLLEKPAPYKVKLKIYEENVYDYEKCKPLKYSVNDYKQMLLEEVNNLQSYIKIKKNPMQNDYKSQNIKLPYI